MSGKYYAIRQAGTNNYLPLPNSVGKGRGNTRCEPTEKGIPRLFTSKDSALRSLILWRQGKHRMEWEDGIVVYHQPHRVLMDMEVVEVTFNVW